MISYTRRLGQMIGSRNLHDSSIVHCTSDQRTSEDEISSTSVDQRDEVKYLNIDTR